MQTSWKCWNLLCCLDLFGILKCIYLILVVILHIGRFPILLDDKKLYDIAVYSVLKFIKIQFLDIYVKLTRCSIGDILFYFNEFDDVRRSEIVISSKTSNISMISLKKYLRFYAETRMRRSKTYLKNPNTSTQCFFEI